MEAAIISEFTGLKCDAPSCDWSDMTITRAQYPDYRNAPCPKCGANVLNDEDWSIILRLEAATAWVNSNADLLKLDKSEPVQSVDVDYDAIKAAITRADGCGA